MIVWISTKANPTVAHKLASRPGVSPYVMACGYRRTGGKMMTLDAARELGAFFCIKCFRKVEP